MRRIIILAAIAIILLVTGLLTVFLGSQNEPVTLTMWHVYGYQTNSDMNELVHEFNKTTGKDKGIYVNVTALANSDYIHTMLVAAANNEPGAGKLPDIFVSYPKTAIAMGADILLDWNEVLSEQEREQYVQAFMDEGVINGRLVVFPIAKSTEVLFMNKTEFDRFSADTGVKIENLATWEGMFDAMARYYDWTDAKTPDIPNNGKPFLFCDSPFNYFQLAARQLGGSFFKGDAVDFDDPAAKKGWELFAVAAAAGHVNLQDGYGTMQIMIGESVCEIGSTASIVYFKDTVTYPDNTTEPLVVTVAPFPVFKGAEKSAVQRGTGLCALKGDKVKEAAAVEFLRCFTGIIVNTDFCSRMGYMPVKKEAYEAFFAGGYDRIEAPDRRSLCESIALMYSDYKFYPSPLFDSYGQLHDDFTAEMRRLLRPYQNAGTADPEEAAAATWAKMRERFGKWPM